MRKRHWLLTSLVLLATACGQGPNDTSPALTLQPLAGPAVKTLDGFTTPNINAYVQIGSTTSTPAAPGSDLGRTVLPVTYTVAAGANTIDLGYRYLPGLGTIKTLDASFNFTNLALTFRMLNNPCSGTTCETMTFQVYEDLDRDGTPQETGVSYNGVTQNEQVWEYRSIALSTSYTTKTMPTSGWRLFGSNTAPGGSNVINWERIGKWVARINRPSGMPAGSNTLYLDELRQTTSYTVPPLTQSEAAFDGSFIQIWNDDTGLCGGCASFTVDQWKKRFGLMQLQGQYRVIVQYSRYIDPTNDVKWYQPTANGTIPLDNLMVAAQQVGMDVILGLNFDATWDSAAKDTAIVYNNAISVMQSVKSDLVTRYGSNPRFVGWYVPQEINNYDWLDADQWGVLTSNIRTNLLKTFLQNVVTTLGTTKPIFIAPYFKATVPADVQADWWKNVLDAAPGITDIIMQDGVGVVSNTVLAVDDDVDVPHYFGKIGTKIGTTTRRFNATIESFKNNLSPATPIGVTSLQSQLAIASSLLNEKYQFAWNMMEPKRGGVYQQFCSDYSTQLLGIAACPLPTAAGW